MIGEMQRRFVESRGGRQRRRFRPRWCICRRLMTTPGRPAATCGSLPSRSTRSRRSGFHATTCGFVASGCAECGREITKRGDTARSFRPVANYRFTEKTCFIVTDAGLRLTATMPVQLAVRRAA